MQRPGTTESSQDWTESSRGSQGLLPWLEPLCSDGLRELGLFGLEKRRLKGSNVISVQKNLKGGGKEEPDSLHSFPLRRPKTVITKWNMRFPLMSGNPSSLCYWPSTGTNSPKRLWSLCPRRYTKTAWTLSCTSCCICPCLSGMGVDQMTSRDSFVCHSVILWSAIFLHHCGSYTCPISYRQQDTNGISPWDNVLQRHLGWLRNITVHSTGLTSPHLLLSKVVQLNTCFWIYSLVLYIPGNCFI